MGDTRGKLLPIWYLRSRREPHHSDWDNGRAARHDSAGGRCGGGLRQLSSMWTEIGAGAGGTGKTSAARRSYLAGRLTGGWDFPM